MKKHQISFVLSIIDAHSNPRHWLFDIISDDLECGESVTDVSIVQYENDETEYTYRVEFCLMLNDESGYDAEIMSVIERHLMEGEKIACFKCEKC